MRMRTATLTLACLVVAATASHAAVAREGIDPGLRAIAAGAPVPIANRPHVSLDAPRRLADRAFGRGTPLAGAPAPEYVAPAEFGVILEFDGTRAELEASGVRVVTQAGRYFTARMRADEVGRLHAIAGIRNARLERYTEPHMNVSIPDVRADLEHAASGTPPVYAGHAGNGILIGDVDTGIDFTRSDFNDASGKTRILYIWDQTDAGGPGPVGFGYGSEWTKSQIDNAPATVRQKDTNGHGTLVGGVLISNGSLTGCSQPAYRFIGVAPLAKYVAVKTTFSDAGIIDGVNYVFQKAAALGMDAVVNLSLGSNFGPHDGSDAFSAAVGALTGPGRIVVASAGNSQGDPIHGKLVATSQALGVDKFTFTVPSYTPASGTFTDYALVSGWYDPTASYTIRVKGPSAGDTLSVGFNDLKDRNLAVSSGKGGKLVIVNQNSANGYGGTAKGRQFEIQVYDSVSTSAPRDGTWEIDVKANDAASIGKRVDVWLYASTFGGAEAAVVTGLDHTTMVGEPADADSVFAVAAHTTKSRWTSCASGNCGYGSNPTVGAIASFSCTGPRRDGVLKPEISAPGFGIASTHSADAPAIGFCTDADDGVHEVTQGTSFSSPHVAAAAALFLESRPHASPATVKQAFESHARTDAFTGAVPNATWGWGKLDIHAAIDHAAPTVAVTAPAGGEAWNEGEAHAITWTAADNVGVTTVDLTLSLDGGATFPVTIATGLANTGSYAWTVPASITAAARIRAVAHDLANNVGTAASSSNFAITQPLATPTLQAPAEFAIHARPNPTTNAAAVELALPRAGDVKLSIVDLQGRELRRLASGAFAAGRYTFTWDGRTSGARAPAGLYFVRCETPSRVLVQRLVVQH
jgi:hypothetical protein